MARVLIQPSPVLQREQAADLERLVEELRGAGFDVDLRAPEYDKSIPTEVIDVGLTVLGTVQDHVIDAVIGYVVGRLGRRQSAKAETKRKARIYGANGQVFREVDLEQGVGEDE